jgi:serine/threonine protein kinase
MRCNRCDTALPREATFCGHCGERVNKQGDTTSSPSNTAIEERYQRRDLIHHLFNENNAQTSQIVQLTHAFDTQQLRPVIIRDLNVSSLVEEERARAIEVAQNEYDQFREQKQADIMSVIDLHYYEKHIYTISGWPKMRKKETRTERFLTLHDLLQSGIGLPDEETALSWAYRICKALQQLHEQNIIVGSLNPRTLAMNSNDYDGLPAVMIFWLPEGIRTLIQAQGTTVPIASKHFSAPEVFRGKAEVRSDIYSVGALLYQLLTGSVPASKQRKRAPRELASSISSGIASVVMQALADNPDERFQSAEEFADILLGLCSSTKTIRPIQHPPLPGESGTPFPQPETERIEAREKSATRTEQPEEASVPSLEEDIKEETKKEDVKEEAKASEDAEAITVKVSPLQVQQARWHLAQLAIETTKGDEEESNRKTDSASEEAEKVQPIPFPEVPSTEESQLSEDELQQAIQRNTIAETPTTQFPPVTHTPERYEKGGQLLSHFREQFSNKLPAISSKLPAISNKLPAIPQKLQATLAAAVQIAQNPGIRESTWLKRLQEFVFGEQQHNIAAAAIIEAPLRIHPGQAYTLRIHLMGRDKLTARLANRTSEGGMGLSGMLYGEQVHIEVRSSLFQNYAYVIQQANVEIPHAGYAAEVIIPMQPLSDGPSGRRERLHVLFSDSKRRPLYERPFAIEIYISHLVAAGQEGHNALTIPL